MQEENEDLKRECHRREEEYDLLSAKYTKSSQTNSELSRQLKDLRHRQEIKRQLFREEILQKRGIEDGASNLLSPKSNRPSRLVSSSLSPTSSDESDEDSEELKKLLRDGEEFSLVCKKELLKRKIKVLKGTILRELSRRRRVTNEAIRDVNGLVSRMKAQEKLFKSDEQTILTLKKIFDKVSTTQAIQIENLRTDLKQKELEKLHFHNANQNTERMKFYSDSANVIDIHSTNPTSFNGFAYDVGDDGANTSSSITAPITTGGDGANKSSSITAPITTGGDGANTSSSIAAPITTGGDGANTSSSIAAPITTGGDGANTSSTITSPITTGGDGANTSSSITTPITSGGNGASTAVSIAAPITTAGNGASTAVSIAAPITTAGNGASTAVSIAAPITTAGNGASTAVSIAAPITTAGNGASTAVSIAAPITTAGNRVIPAASATVSSATDIPSHIANQITCDTFTSGTSYPLRRKLDKGGTTSVSKNSKRKETSDIDEPPKKKSSIELPSQDDASQIEGEAKRRIMELERNILFLKKQLTDVGAYNIELQQGLKEMSRINNRFLSKQEIDVITSTGLDQDESPPVSSITREDAKQFSSVQELQYASFSEIHYQNARMNPKFLLYKPIGISNLGRTFSYMNSVVQALANIPVFAVNLVCRVESEKGDLLHAMYDVYKHLWVRRPTARKRNRPSVLQANEIRSYFAKNRRPHFKGPKIMYGEKFLLDLISILETEMILLSDYEEEDNIVTRLFQGYIVDPDGTTETFRTLRLRIEDKRIDSVKNALLYHLLIKSSEPPGPVPAHGPVAVPVPVNSSSSSTKSINHAENLTIPENTDQNSQMIQIKTNELAGRTSTTGKITNSQRPDGTAGYHNADQSSQESRRTTSTYSTCRETSASNSSPDDFPSDSLFPGKYKKIHTPDILCVSLDRIHMNYKFNWKILPAEDLTIPADLAVTEGVTRPVHYKLMSIIQYIPMGPSAGHYYTYVISGRDWACRLNDDIVSYIRKDSIDLAAFGGCSSIFVYARKPENLQETPGLN